MIFRELFASRPLADTNGARPPMQLVRVVLSARGPQDEISPARVAKLVSETACDGDGLEHVRVVLRPRRLFITVFLLGPCAVEGRATAYAICVRMLASKAELSNWQLEPDQFTG